MRRIRKGLPSGRWLLEYADLRPLDESSPECQIFLATNIVFFAAGGALVGSSPALALQLELAGMASVWYHYTQCCYGGTQHPSVQLAILIDYIFAVPTALRTLVLVLGLGGAVPPSAILAGVGSFVCGAGGGLGVGWTPRVHGVARCLASARGTLRVRGGHRGCGLTVPGVRGVFFLNSGINLNRSA